MLPAFGQRAFSGVSGRGQDTPDECPGHPPQGLGLLNRPDPRASSAVAGITAVMNLFP